MTLLGERAVSETITLSPAPPAAAVGTARYVLLKLASQLTGYTVKAIQRKIESGVWTQDQVWIRAPDGRIMVDLVGYHRWVQGKTPALSPSRVPADKSE